MLTLGMDTSGRIGRVALCRGGVCLEERILKAVGQRHAQCLIPEIQSLFHKFGVKPYDCQLVAVSIGPGSFTGLRIAVVFAKTFSYAIGCPVVAVDTFQGIAESSPPDLTDVFVIGNAQRDQLYVGHYCRGSGDTWQRRGEITIHDAASWCQSRQATDVVTGPGLEKFECQLATCCRVQAPAYWQPQAAIIARIGERKIQQNSADDIWSLEPFYVRKSAAEEKWDATHGNA